MRLSILLTGFLALALCAPAGAEVISLKDLIDENLSIQNGDKLFDQFDYSATGNMPDASAVNVATFTDQDGNFGISFTGGFVDLYGGGASDALIRYRVSVVETDPLVKIWISDAHLYGNPIAIGEAIMQVSESFTEEPNEHLTIHHVSPGGGDDVQRADVVVFDTLHKELHVQKDILALAKSEGSAATMSLIDQSFSQVIYIVPEPATIMILAVGLALMSCFIRRNRR